MHWDEIRDNWRYWRQRAQERWPRLTDDDLMEVAGQRCMLVLKIQEIYDIEKEDAERDVDNFYSQCGEECSEVFLG